MTRRAAIDRERVYVARGDLTNEPGLRCTQTFPRVLYVPITLPYITVLISPLVDVSRVQSIFIVLLQTCMGSVLVPQIHVDYEEFS